jgi:dihydrofolate reductase
MKAAGRRAKKRAQAKLKTSVFCGTSLDGFLARPDDTFDFLRAGEAEPHGFIEFLNSVDVVVMGRRTFEVVRDLGHLGQYGKKQVMVLSSRHLDLSSIKDADIKQMQGTPRQIIAQLDKLGFRHAYIDGGLTIQRFLAAGCVDRITVTRVPVLIGQGIPLFGPLLRDIQLRHVVTRSYPDGMVQSVYEIGTKPRPKPART